MVEDQRGDQANPILLGQQVDRRQYLVVIGTAEGRDQRLERGEIEAGKLQVRPEGDFA